MTLRTLGLVPLFLLNLAWAAESVPGWLSDPQHPSLQYRFVCKGGSSQSVVWRNGYPGTVSVKAHMRNYNYDGTEDVEIEPGATTNTNLQTLNCGNFQISVTRFSMAPPPPPPAHTSTDTKAASVAPPKAEPPAVPPILVMFEPQTEPTPEITTDALASISIGMNQTEVKRRLGDPLSKMSIPDDRGMIETYRYQVTKGRSGVVKFTNGMVASVISPR